MPKTKQSPGSILLDYLAKYDLNCNRLSQEIKCSQTALRLISLDKSRITTSIAVRLGKYFSTKPEFWLLTQMDYDLAQAASNKTLSKALKEIPKVGKSTIKKVKAGRPKAVRSKTKKTGRTKK